MCAVARNLHLRAWLQLRLQLRSRGVELSGRERDGREGKGKGGADVACSRLRCRRFWFCLEGLYDRQTDRAVAESVAQSEQLVVWIFLCFYVYLRGGGERENKRGTRDGIDKGRTTIPCASITYEGNMGGTGAGRLIQRGRHSEEGA